MDISTPIKEKKTIIFQAHFVKIMQGNYMRQTVDQLLFVLSILHIAKLFLFLY